MLPKPEREPGLRHSFDGIISGVGLGPGENELLSDTERFILEILVRLDEADSQTENLKRALENSRNIGAAMGIVMAFRKMTQDEAFEWLRRASQDQNRKLYDVARDVIATGDCQDGSPRASEASPA